MQGPRSQRPVWDTAHVVERHDRPRVYVSSLPARLSAPSPTPPPWQQNAQQRVAQRTFTMPCARWLPSGHEFGPLSASEPGTVRYKAWPACVPWHDRERIHAWSLPQETQRKRPVRDSARVVERADRLNLNVSSAPPTPPTPPHTNTACCKPSRPAGCDPVHHVFCAAAATLWLALHARAKMQMTAATQFQLAYMQHMQSI
jgi:hypothetical protein